VDDAEKKEKAEDKKEKEVVKNTGQQQLTRTM